ncbi:MAG: spore maturation protein [Dysgonamonadaceae bacterium]|jgi:spore maturation protein SpmA|nr:spore maturation protein [Dysgonamonadaceae bacterium]
MALNYIWVAFFLIAFFVGLYKLIFTGDVNIFTEMMNSSFSSARTAFDISIGLTGILSLWLGFMKIGEKAGVVNFIARIASPVFSRLFPDIPKGHPASGSIFMNIAANMLNLDNAATPLGLKAMKELQELNGKKDTASNSMIMFLVLNASGLTLIPITIMVYRAQMGSVNPSNIFIPLMLATTIATIAGILFVSIKQKINLLDRVLIRFFGGIVTLIIGIVSLVKSFPQEKVAVYSSLVANCLLFCIIIAFIIAGIKKKVNVYDAFIEGAKEGFKTAVMIIPYLVAMLVAIAFFRASGAMTFLTDAITGAVSFLGLPSDWVTALPTAIMKPLSGSGARGMMLDTMQTYGADSFAGLLASIFQGSTDTTFYLVAVYYGAVNIKNTRYTVSASLLADLAGVISAIFVCYLFFG